MGHKVSRGGTEARRRLRGRMGPESRKTLILQGLERGGRVLHEALRVMRSRQAQPFRVGVRVRSATLPKGQLGVQKIFLTLTRMGVCRGLSRLCEAERGVLSRVELSTEPLPTRSVLTFACHDLLSADVFRLSLGVYFGARLLRVECATRKNPWRETSQRATAWQSNTITIPTAC